MLRTIPLLVVLICGAALVADAKPIFIKVFSPSGGYSANSYQSTVTPSPATTQLLSSLLNTKFQILNSVLQAKSTGGSFGFGINKFVTFSSTTTTTEKPVTYHTTEVNTDFTPDDDLSSTTPSTTTTTTTQTVYTTTTEGAIQTPKPTIHPDRPVTTSTSSPVIPVESTTSQIPDISTTTGSSNGYTYRTPGPIPVTSTVSTYYLPSSLA